jgi:replicative DNA helicase
MNQYLDTNVDNLAKYGPTFQSKVLSCLVTLPEFFRQSLDVLTPTYFESDASQWIVNKTVSYFSEYKTLPTNEVFALEVKQVPDDVLKIAIVEQLRTINKRKNDEDLQYVQDSFLEFAKNQALKSAIVKSVDLLQLGRYNEIKTLVDSALRAGQPKNIGHNWKEDYSLRLAGNSRTPVPTGWEPIDLLTGGGLGAGELGVIVAPSGIGKSWALSTIGANAARQGKTVAHYTFELNENYVGLRYDTVFSGIESGQIINHPDEIKNLVDTIPGEIIVKFYPARAFTVHTIHAHLDSLISNKMKPDIIIVDYADLMRSTDRADARHQELGFIYEELRALGSEFKVPCWTASQAQRSSLQDDIIEADKIAESYAKIMTSDLAISLSRKLEDKAHHTGRAHVMKNRFGADGITFPMYINTSTGRIEIYDETSSKGILLKKQMQAGEGLLKKNLAQKFNELHGNSLHE